VVSFTPQALYPWYPLERRLGGPQSQCGHDGKKKNIPAHARKYACMLHTFKLLKYDD